MAEGLMRENARRLGREHHGIFARLDRHGAAQEGRLLGHGGADRLGQALQFVKAGRALLPVAGELLFALRHIAGEGQAAGLVIIGDIRAQAGLEMEQAAAIQIGAGGHGDAFILAQQRQVGQQQRLLILGGDIAHGAIGKAQHRVAVALKTAHGGIVQNLIVGRSGGVQAVQRLLQVVQIGHGGVIPHFAVINPQEGAALHLAFHFLQNTGLIGNDGAAAILGAHIGIKAVAELNHQRNPPCVTFLYYTIICQSLAISMGTFLATL